MSDAEKYDPTAANQHAQLLFDSVDAARLPDLYDWLSRKNIDANVAPHAEILEQFNADEPVGG